MIALRCSVGPILSFNPFRFVPCTIKVRFEARRLYQLHPDNSSILTCEEGAKAEALATKRERIADFIMVVLYFEGGMHRSTYYLEYFRIEGIVRHPSNGNRTPAVASETHRESVTCEHDVIYTRFEEAGPHTFCDPRSSTWIWKWNHMYM